MFIGLVLLYVGAILTDNTIDYNECKSQEFKGLAPDHLTKCEDMLELYKFDKKSVDKGIDQ